MGSKLKDQISEAIVESKKQIENIVGKGSLTEKGREAAELAREAAEKAREKAGKAAEVAHEKVEKATAKAREKAGETAAMGAVTITKISEKVHTENLVRMADQVREEVRHTLLAETLSDIARLRDDTDELRRRMTDMQKVYDKKIADLQEQLKAAQAAPKAPRAPRARKPAAE